MAVRFGVTVDCSDPARLAAFWRELLEYVDDPAPEGFDTWADYDRAHGVGADEAGAGHTIVDPAGAGPRLYFQPVAEGKQGKNRWHLDVAVSAAAPSGRQQAAIDAGTERAVALGATVIGRSAHDDDLFTVLTDPEGNEFCLT
jgi:hypothetical protein